MASWLDRIEALDQGDEVEFVWPADGNKSGRWHRGEVVYNGGEGLWTIRVAEDWIYDRSGDGTIAAERGDVFRFFRIEHVRCPGDEGAWPL